MKVLKTDNTLRKSFYDLKTKFKEILLVFQDKIVHHVIQPLLLTQALLLKFNQAFIQQLPLYDRLHLLIPPTPFPNRYIVP